MDNSKHKKNTYMYIEKITIKTFRNNKKNIVLFI